MMPSNPSNKEKMFNIGYEVFEVYKNAISFRKKLEDNEFVYCTIHFEEKTIEFSTSSSAESYEGSPYPAPITDMEAAIDILYAKVFVVSFF